MAGLEDLTQIIAVVGLIIAVGGLIPLYIDLYLRWKERRSIEFLIQRFSEPVKKPVESNWSIRILHPNKLMERCTVLYDSVPLPWWDGEDCYYERTIEIGGGGNVRIPKSIEEENPEIIVKDGKKIVKKKRFKEIPIAQR